MAAGTIALIGAGGIGAFYAARLTEAGDDVVAVARGAHLRALREHGLRVDHPQRPFRGDVRACALADLVAEDPRRFDVVIVLTKATATADLASTLAGWIGAAPTAVASLQNGVDNEVAFERALGRERVIGGYSVRLGGHVVAPGHVECVGDCETWIGVWPDTRSGSDAARERVARLAARLGAAGLATRIADDVRRELWRKLVLNSAVNPLSALLERDTRRLSHDADTSWLVRAIMDETVAVGRADGVALSAADAHEMFELIRGFPPIRTSMLVDLDRDRELETDAICGAVLERARRLGVDVPCTRTVASLLAAKLADREAGPRRRR